MPRVILLTTTTGHSDRTQRNQHREEALLPVPVESQGHSLPRQLVVKTLGGLGLVVWHPLRNLSRCKEGRWSA